MLNDRRNLQEPSQLMCNLTSSCTPQGARIASSLWVRVSKAPICHRSPLYTWSTPIPLPHAGYASCLVDGVESGGKPEIHAVRFLAWASPA